MALKDWKKTHEDKTLIIYEKDTTKVGVMYNRFLGKWIGGPEDYAKTFKTKYQALKFTKEYMRTH